MTADRRVHRAGTAADPCAERTAPAQTTRHADRVTPPRYNGDMSSNCRYARRVIFTLPRFRGPGLQEQHRVRREVPHA